jgi:hypothetical protein
MHKETVFERTYEDYLAQVSGIDFNSVKQKLGVEVERNEACSYNYFVR